MDLASWATLVGALFIGTALAGSSLSRLPLSTAMLYLAVGLAVSPLLFGLSQLRPERDAGAVTLLAEVALLVSLFTAGMKLGARPGDHQWAAPVRLATVSMLATAGFITAAGIWLLDLPVGAAILLGGLLAPTDPVLAAEVQVADDSDRDELRYALTGEGGLNDGTAFPIVTLGLSLLGLRAGDAWGWHWLLVDVLWGTAAGLAIGAVLGAGVGRLVLYLRRIHREALGLDNFLALGLVSLSCGLAMFASASVFLAVFAAGFGLRQLERRATARAAHENVTPVSALDADASEDDKAASHPSRAPAYMAHAVQGFNEQIERVGEVAAVIVLGMLLWAVQWQHAVWWFVALVLLVMRPVAVAAGLIGSRPTAAQRGLIAWFGIRGIGTLYYLLYALGHGLSGTLGDTVTALTLSVVVASIVLHGISVTPLMALYQRALKPRPSHFAPTQPRSIAMRR
jgi:NhaP-type Na+/H+ or K+/H+ antiporter